MTEMKISTSIAKKKNLTSPPFFIEKSEAQVKSYYELA